MRSRLRTGELKKFATLAIFAFCMIGLNQQLLAQEYAFNGNKQAAMPDPYGHRLYLAIDGAHGVASETYLVHVMHHELQHNTEYALWQNQYYKWSAWQALNKPGFNYGNGGITACTKNSGNYYTLNNPIPGFVNHYSVLGQGEDRAEIFALMMSDLERPYLDKMCGKDPIIKAKVQAIAQFVSNFGGARKQQAYWVSRNSVRLGGDERHENSSDDKSGESMIKLLCF